MQTQQEPARAGGSPSFKGSGSRQLVDEVVDGGEPAVLRDNKVSPGISGRFTRASRHPFYPGAVAQHLRFGDRLVPKFGMISLDNARNPIDLIAALVGAAFWVVENAIFAPDLVYDRPTADEVVFSKRLKIAQDQGRDAVAFGRLPLYSRTVLRIDQLARTRL
jgi:hypothetical protein